MLLFLLPMFRVHTKSILPRFSLLLTPSRAHRIHHVLHRSFHRIHHHGLGLLITRSTILTLVDFLSFRFPPSMALTLAVGAHVAKNISPCTRSIHHFGFAWSSTIWKVPLPSGTNRCLPSCPWQLGTPSASGFTTVSTMTNTNVSCAACSMFGSNL